MVSESAPEPPDKKGSWLPSPKKMGEFILATIQIQRSVETLKKENEKLTNEIKRLQRQVDEQAGQLKTIQTFIQSSVYENAARSGERAALQLFEQMMRPAVEDKKKR
jgi:FtsZ-binding cell division protein ZapB